MKFDRVGLNPSLLTFVYFQSSLTILIFLCQPLCPLSNPCPNSCNKRGNCDAPNRKCECFEGFSGPDCSLTDCPLGRAWADVSSGLDKAHQLAVCSNMGICEPYSGICICRQGFDGKACEKTACPYKCSGHGICRSMERYALTKDPGLGTIYQYNSVWDAQKIYGCDCEHPYFGVDCSLRNCPTGDDPLTGSGIETATNPLQFNEIQRVSCRAEGGTFTLTFRGFTTPSISYDADRFAVAQALLAIPSITGVSVNFFGNQACTGSGTSFTVEFTQQFGRLPNMIPDGRALTASRGISLIVDLQQPGSKEDDVCSNRGICDVTLGNCMCSGLYGTSNGYGAVGPRGDCGSPLSVVQFCPGAVSCSSHGICSGKPTFRCTCSDGWTGADCSEKVCPVGSSWFTLPEGHDRAHLSEARECSDRGFCDRTTGNCQCLPGFTGPSCNLLTCPFSPLPCSGHGGCYDMATLATFSAINGDAAGFVYGSIPGDPMTWDSNRIFGCYCNSGWSGYDCSLQTCPFGDDPNTTEQYDEIQAMRCADSDGKGTFVISYKQQSSDLIPASATTATVKMLLEAVPGVNTVIVELEDTSKPDMLCTPQGNAFFVTFKQNHGDLPMMQYTTQGVDQLVIEEVYKGNKETIECSGRGLCERTIGMCSCFVGYSHSDGMGGRGSTGDCGFMLAQVID